MWLLKGKQSNDSKSKSARSPAKWTPSYIQFPEHLTDAMTGDSINLDPIINNRIKVLILLNTGCYRCIEDLPKWEEFIGEFPNQDQIQFVFIAQAPTRKYLEYMITRRAQIHQPVFYDSLNFVGRTNHIHEIPTTMLLDQKNKVVLAGSPILHPELKTMYHDNIENLLYRKDGTEAW